MKKEVYHDDLDNYRQEQGREGLARPDRDAALGSNSPVPGVRPGFQNTAPEIRLKPAPGFYIYNIRKLLV
jgi:hypothetical protein